MPALHYGKQQGERRAEAVMSEPRFPVGTRFMIGTRRRATVIEVVGIVEDGVYDVAIGRRDTLKEEFLLLLRKVNPKDFEKVRQ